MAIHNSMVEICCYAAPIAMEITSESLDRIEFFNTHRAKHSPRFLIRTYSFTSEAGATREATAAPSVEFVSGSSRNLRMICGTSGEDMKL
jgi:hypothetical protein